MIALCERFQIPCVINKNQLKWVKHFRIKHTLIVFGREETIYITPTVGKILKYII